MYIKQHFMQFDSHYPTHRPLTPPTLPPRLDGKFLALNKAPLTPLISDLKLEIASSSLLSTPPALPLDEPETPGEFHVPYDDTGP